MLSRVNLVAILLTLNCVICATEHAESPRERRQPDDEKSDVAAGGTVLRYASSGNATSATSTASSAENGRNAVDWLTKVWRDHEDVHDDARDSKIATDERDRPRRRKRRMDRAVLALLMAYKMKFVAMIPTIIGGLILLKGTTLLAGFFFALFAAVLGLKVH